MRDISVSHTVCITLPRNTVTRCRTRSTEESVDLSHEVAIKSGCMQYDLDFTNPRWLGEIWFQARTRASLSFNAHEKYRMKICPGYRHLTCEWRGSRPLLPPFSVTLAGTCQTLFGDNSGTLMQWHTGLSSDDTLPETRTHEEFFQRVKSSLFALKTRLLENLLHMIHLAVPNSSFEYTSIHETVCWPLTRSTHLAGGCSGVSKLWKFWPMEASSKPNSRSSDVENNSIQHSPLKNGGYSEDGMPREAESSSSTEITHIDPAREAAFLKRMDYRMVPLLFLICES